MTRYHAPLHPRHVPNEILQIEEVPRTLGGNKLQVPVKKIRSGTSVEVPFANPFLGLHQLLHQYTNRYTEYRLLSSKIATVQHQFKYCGFGLFMPNSPTLDDTS